MSMNTKKSKFELRCEKAAESIGVEVEFEPDPSMDSVFEDDGALHIRVGGRRAIFIVNPTQDESAVIQNARTRKIMEDLGVKRKINERVLVDEEEDAECCSECGRAF
jgi:hypothetical protein